jgi:membrane protein YqaA with SNARE-associated domain
MMLFLLIVAGSVWKWMHRLGGPGLILLGVADNAPFISAPAGSVDVFVILLSAHRHEWWAYYAFMATVGEVLGGYLAYRLAAKGGQETLEKKVGKPRAAKIYKQFEKRGSVTVFIGSILPPPFPFTSVLMAAGIMQYPPKNLFSALTAGRAVRFFAVAYLGRIYGQQMIGFFSRHYRPVLYVLIALAVTAGIGALVYFKWYRPKAQREERELGEQVEQFPVPGRHPRHRDGASPKTSGSE